MRNVLIKSLVNLEEFLRKNSLTILKLSRWVDMVKLKECWALYKEKSLWEFAAEDLVRLTKGKNASEYVCFVKSLYYNAESEGEKCAAIDALGYFGLMHPEYYLEMKREIESIRDQVLRRTSDLTEYEVELLTRGHYSLKRLCGNYEKSDWFLEMWKEKEKQYLRPEDIFEKTWQISVGDFCFLFEKTKSGTPLERHDAIHLLAMYAEEYKELVPLVTPLFLKLLDSEDLSVQHDALAACHQAYIYDAIPKIKEISNVDTYNKSYAQHVYDILCQLKEYNDKV